MCFWVQYLCFILPSLVSYSDLWICLCLLWSLFFYLALEMVQAENGGCLWFSHSWFSLPCIRQSIPLVPLSLCPTSFTPPDWSYVIRPGRAPINRASFGACYPPALLPPCSVTPCYYTLTSETHLVSQTLLLALSCCMLKKPTKRTLLEQLGYG
jgi:hypothetical protein